MASGYTAYNGSSGSQFRLYVFVEESSTNVSANTSEVRYRLRMYRVSGTSRFWHLVGTNDASLTITGETDASTSSATYDFNLGVGSYQTLLDVTRTVDHATNGTGSASASGYHDPENSPYLTATTKSLVSLTLTNFPEPAAGSFSSSNIKYNKATISASVSTNGNGTSTTLTFYKRKVGAGSWDNEGTGTSKALTGLSANTDYEWYVNATNNTGNTSNSATQSFTTQPSPAGFLRILGT